MVQVSEFPQGTFCWADLMTSDAATAKKFYCGLFGWNSVDMPTGGNPYTMLSLGGDHVCALTEMDAAMKGQGIPPHWQNYIMVDSVDEMADKAVKLGATLAMPPFDVMEAGRMAFIADPSGAFVALWQKKLHGGASRVGEPGAVCWNELMTRDAAAAEKFYSEMFGWTNVRMPNPMGGEYVQFQKDRHPVAGMFQIRPEMGEMPSNWGVYFAVDDCDAAVQKAERLGATKMMPPVDIPNTGRFCTLADPQHAMFSVIKLAPM